jgi:hypothetical protein
MRIGIGSPYDFPEKQLQRLSRMLRSLVVPAAEYALEKFPKDWLFYACFNERTACHFAPFPGNYATWEDHYTTPIPHPINRQIAFVYKKQLPKLLVALVDMFDTLADMLKGIARPEPRQKIR